MTMQHPPEAPPAPPQRGFVALLAAMAALGPMSIDMYLPSIGRVAQDLDVAIESLQSTVAIFLFGLAAGQLVYGPLSDRIGRRAPILIGLAVFVLGSAISSFARSLPILLAGRLGQALGVCACLVVARAIVRDRFDLRESARLFSLLALISGMAPVLAPVVGAGLLTLFGWRGIFALLGLFGAMVWVWVWRGLAETRSAHTEQQARQEHPIRSYLTLLGKPQLLGFLGAGTFNGAALFTYVASSPTIFMDVYGLSPSQFSLLFGLNSIGLVGASQINRHLLRTYSVETVLRWATVCCAIVAAWLPLAAVTGFGGLTGLAAPLFLAVSTVAMIQANAMAEAMAVDPTRAGSTAALYGAGSFAAGALFAWLSALLYDRSPGPMAIIIAVCFCCSAVILMLALRIENKRQRDALAAKHDCAQ